MNVLAIMATAGRHTYCERAVGMFLQQDYQNKHLLIWQNSPIEKKLDKEYSNITLINNNLNSQNKERYKTLGEIYNDILEYVYFSPTAPKHMSADIICHWDDDDMYLPNHISEGVRGFLEGGKKAYKPNQSYYAYLEKNHQTGVQERKITKSGNNMEPSVFVSANHLFVHGYEEKESVAHHLKWFNPLLNNQDIFIDLQGKPTFIYDWGSSQIPCYKTSGNPGNPYNFENYHSFSQDHGDTIIRPWEKEQVNTLFKNIFENV